VPKQGWTAPFKPVSSRVENTKIHGSPAIILSLTTTSIPPFQWFWIQGAGIAFVQAFKYFVAVNSMGHASKKEY
jgi:hypothetical protein